MTICAIDATGWDLLLKGATVLIGGFTLYKAFKEFRDSRNQRAADLHWRQAEAAKKLIDDWMDDKMSHDFCKMIEYDDREFENEEKQKFLTDAKKINEALLDDEVTRKTKLEVDKRYIRDCCDTFLYFTEMMSQGEKNKLYRLNDILFPLCYYLDRMKYRGIYEAVKKYAKGNGFCCQDNLFDRVLVLKTEMKSEKSLVL